MNNQSFRTHIREPYWQQLASVTVIVLVLVALFGRFLFVPTDSPEEPTLTPTSTTTSPLVVWDEAGVTERFSARVDRVDVVFAHKNYTQYQLQTNGLLRAGELNTERGYGEDEDATVYVLNWREDIAQQIRYVRLSAEPDYLYYLDSENKIIAGTKLTRQ